MRTPTVFHPTRRGLALLVALATTLGVLLGAPAAASAAIYLKIEGIGSSTPGGCLDCSGPVMGAFGTATCEACVAGEPTSGNFTITLGVQTYPPSPCRVRSVAGTLEILWNDDSTSSATVSGKFRDSKALSLTGAFDAADAVYPGDPLKILLENFPSNPCLSATNPITGTLAISTP
jgi:hypothetical protein